MRRYAVGALAFGTAAAGSLALGYAARRRALAGIEPTPGPEWDELHRPVHGAPVTVRSFDGTRLHAEVLGPDDAPTVVLVHGYGLSQHAWHYQRRDLRDRVRLVCYDQRGHGASSEAPSGDYRMSALGRDLGAVLDATVPPDRPVVVAGHSMGGMTVLSFADQFPERLGGLAGIALMSTAGGNVVAGGAFTAGAATLATLRSRMVPRRLRRGEPAAGRGEDPEDWTDVPPTDTVFLLTRALGLSADAHPAHVAFTEQLLRECPGRVKAALGPAVTSLRLTHVAEQLTMPGVVLVGDADRLTPAGQARRLADAMPRTTLHLVPGAGHMLPLEAHERVTDQLRGLVAGLAEAGSP